MVQCGVKTPRKRTNAPGILFNVVIGIILAGGLCLVAPWIARFYHQPQLTALTRFFSLTLVVDSFAVVQSAMMVRHLDFKKQAIISATSTGISGIIGLALAWRGFGVWSLVVQQVAASVIRTALYWSMNSWRAAMAIQLHGSQRRMFHFRSSG